jgi:hypothetical protein
LMRLPFALAILAAGVLSHPAHAHQQPTTLVVLDVTPERVNMSLHVPLNELELAFGNAVTQDPEANLKIWEPQFRSYLLRHIHADSGKLNPWTVKIDQLKVQRAEQTQSGAFQEVHVFVSLTPPTGVSPEAFTLYYDVILHQVVTHKALVSMKGKELGIIAVNPETARISPMDVQLTPASPWSSFKDMVALGMHHIKEGPDHLLFLLTLLLPATLRTNGRRWAEFGGSHYSLMRLLKLVTAFTVGHSLTLLVGAVGRLSLPQQPVEVLIAFSILVSALHAMRPLFPEKEIHVAAGFGLVHGLAFATAIADLQLSASSLALSILGFNLGIELMQLFVIAVTMPWLIVLSLTPCYRWVRMSCALLASVAAVGWMLNRISGQPNIIEQLMQPATQLAPLGILILALITIPAYFLASPEPVEVRTKS